MATSSPRKVRPGELPAFGSVWRWSSGPPIMALSTSWEPGQPRYLVGIWLGRPAEVDRGMIWASKSHVGLGSVLSTWECLEEAPDA